MAGSRSQSVKCPDENRMSLDVDVDEGYKNRPDSG